jgi:subtilisin family serine protease
VAAGLDILAPAVGGGERKWTGTSFACPHVAAHAARIIGKRGKTNTLDVRAALHSLARGRGHEQGDPK